MPSDFETFLWALLIVCVVISLVGMFSDQSQLPTDLKPGDAVFVTTGKTVIQSGKPCQENKAGFISPNSPNGSNTWVLPSTLLWPTSQDFAVIFMDGSIDWQNESNVVKSPAPAEALLCPVPIK